MNKYKVVLKYLIIYFVMIIGFVGSLYITSLIPKKSIEKNALNSIFEYRSADKTLYEFGLIRKIYIDDWTDAIMLNEIYSSDNKDVLKSIMLNPTTFNVNWEMEQIANNDYENIFDNPVDRLYEIQDKTGSGVTYEYARYWNGYKVFLRPMLTMFSFDMIKIIFMIILNGLGIYLLYRIKKKTNIIISLIFGVSLIIVSYHICGMSIQYFAVSAISIISSIIITFKSKIKPEMFFIIGGMTCFFDMLTYPLITLGLPIITYLVTREEKTIKNIIIYSINWILGFALIWFGKWILTDIIYNKGLITESFKQALYRLGNKVGEHNVGEVVINPFIALWKNIEYIKIEMIIAASSVFVLTVYALIKKKDLKDLKYFYLLAVLPLVYYILTQNHSYMHAKYAYRNLIITLISAGIIDYKIIKSLIKKKNEVN